MENTANLSMSVDLNDKTVAHALSVFFAAIAGTATNEEPKKVSTPKRGKTAKEVAGAVVQEETKPLETAAPKKEEIAKPGQPKTDIKEASKAIQEKIEEVNEAKKEDHNITIDDIKALVGSKTINSANKDANKDQIKARITEMGAANIPKLDKKFYPELVKFINTLT